MEVAPVYELRALLPKPLLGRLRLRNRCGPGHPGSEVINGFSNRVVDFCAVARSCATEDQAFCFKLLGQVQQYGFDVAQIGHQSSASSSSSDPSPRSAGRGSSGAEVICSRSGATCDLSTSSMDLPGVWIQDIMPER